MANPIDINQLYEQLPGRVLMDVRTPAEFAQGHIPGAVNLPLFTNDERAEVGTIYKQQGPEPALLRGLELVGPKMRGYVETAKELAPEGKVILHCWRGGQRSGSMSWLLDMAGLEVSTIKGGYKAFRQMAHQYFAEAHHRLLILGGPTGAGKTKILHALRDKGEYIVDLEALAHHKGSSFGALGQPPQPTTEQFENDLFAALHHIPAGATVWLEDESRAIGRLYLPDPFWRRMMAAPLLQLNLPLHLRIDNLLEDYARFPKSALVAAFERIRKRMGGQHVKAAVEALERDDYATAAEIALHYYDRAYAHTLSGRPEQPRYTLAVATRDPVAAAEAALGHAGGIGSQTAKSIR